MVGTRTEPVQAFTSAAADPGVEYEPLQGEIRRLRTENRILREDLLRLRRDYDALRRLLDRVLTYPPRPTQARRLPEMTAGTCVGPRHRGNAPNARD
jgi:hypothetical protein